MCELKKSFFYFLSSLLKYKVKLIKNDKNYCKSKKCNQIFTVTSRFQKILITF